MIAPVGWVLAKVFDTAGEVAGWAFDKVIRGVYTWVANGLVLLLQLVWRAMDQMATPRLTASWFANGLMRDLAALSGAVVVAMAFLNAIQVAVAGRPELAWDTVRSAVTAWLSTILLVVVVDLAVIATDQAAGLLWESSRPKLAAVSEVLASVAVRAQEAGQSFVMPAVVVVTIVAAAVLMFVFLLRGALLYVAAAFAPLVFAGAVHPSMRSARAKMVHTLVALVLAKLAIAVALVVSVNVIASGADPGTSPEQQLFTVMTGAVCFILGAVAPWLLYRLIPVVEQAGVMHGVGSTMFRGAMTAVQVAMIAHGATSRSAASRPIPGPNTCGVGGASGISGDAGDTSSAVPSGAGGSPAGRPVPEPVAGELVSP